MSFTSVGYLFFLFLAAALCRLTPRRTYALWILLTSVAFYSLWDVRAFLPICAATAVVYIAALYVDSDSGKSGRLVVVFGAIVLLLASLLLLKILPRGTRPFEWLVPLGISYYTFKLVSYLLDVFWGKYPAERDPIAFASYALFFPQIVAGPIQRADDYLKQLRTPQPLSRELVQQGIGRIAIGLFKKLLIADNIGLAVNAVYSGPHAFTGAPLLAAMYLFPVQLYADFSGLTDIANGSALLLGIKAPENFDRPFSVANISDYWRRWHMSLTHWMGDYVFTPLRVATRNWGRAGLVFSITVNMMSVALWHGIAWTYASFGVVHCVFLSCDALTVRARKTLFRAHPSWKPWAGWTGAVLTFHQIALAMVFFRARTVSDAWWIFSHLATPLAKLWPGLIAFLDLVGLRSVAVGLIAYALLEVVERVRVLTLADLGLQSEIRWLRWGAYSTAAAVLVVGLLLMVVHGSTHEAFLYEVF